MKNIFDIYEGIFDKGNRQNVGKSLSQKVLTEDFFKNLKYVGDLKINEDGIVSYRSVIINDENFEGFPDYIKFENDTRFGAQLIIKNSKKLKEASHFPAAKRLVFQFCENFTRFSKDFDSYAEEVCITECPKFETLEGMPSVNYLELEYTPNIKNLKGINNCYLSFAARETGLQSLDGIENTYVQTVLLSANRQLTDISMLPKSVTRLLIRGSRQFMDVNELIKHCPNVDFNKAHLELNGRTVKVPKYKYK